ncbi:MAG TPA: fumarylacetoacetate hydrolase family protein [Thermoanaerobaculaceae bacterium]|nr:fumarylacetoacetate hydrolase family protein [Thermoanaerobaculaceae bacterium]
MRVATVRSDAGHHVAVLAVRAGAPAWVPVADAARLLLGDDACPAALAGLLRRDGPELPTVRRVLAALEGEWPSFGLAAWAPAEVRFAPPVLDPGAFLDFYAFERHVRASRARRGLEMPEQWYRFPAYYRSNHRSFLGSGAQVRFPAGETMMDFELEVAAVLGAPLRHASPAEAEAAIAGFCLLNDWSARALQREVMAIGLGPSKAKDFGTSLGPWLVTPDEAGELGGIAFAVRVNGETWSETDAAAMHWSWGELLAFASEDADFEPGDVFGSGTLGGGCGLELGRFLADGDAVELDGGERFGVLAGTVRRREG